MLRKDNEEKRGLLSEFSRLHPFDKGFQQVPLQKCPPTLRVRRGARAVGGSKRAETHEKSGAAQRLPSHSSAVGGYGNSLPLSVSNCGFSMSLDRNLCPGLGLGLDLWAGESHIILFLDKRFKA